MSLSSSFFETGSGVPARSSSDSERIPSLLSVCLSVTLRADRPDSEQIPSLPSVCLSVTSRADRPDSNVRGVIRVAGDLLWRTFTFPGRDLVAPRCEVDPRGAPTPNGKGSCYPTSIPFTNLVGKVPRGGRGY